MSQVNPQEFDLAKQRLPIFKTAAAAYGFPDEVAQALSPGLGPDWLTWVLAGMDSRESGFGRLLDGDGLGDYGHGHGEMQIDDRSHPAFCASGKWRDLGASLEYVHKSVIVPNFNFLGRENSCFFTNDQGVIDYGALFRATIAGYNCGAGNVVNALDAEEDVDSRTTEHDYSADVFARAQALAVALGNLPAPIPTSLAVEVQGIDDYGVKFPMIQADLEDLFGEPDEGGPFTQNYVRFIDLSPWQEQLNHVRGLSNKAGFGFFGNYVMQVAVKQAIKNICDQGLAHELISWDGCHCVRHMTSNSDELSVHSWALAIDWNAKTNPFTYGKLVTTFSPAFVKCWTQAGFEWGGAWLSCHDAMHFQFALTHSEAWWQSTGSLWIPAIPYQKAA